LHNQQVSGSPITYAEHLKLFFESHNIKPDGVRYPYFEWVVAAGSGNRWYFITNNKHEMKNACHRGSYCNTFVGVNADNSLGLTHLTLAILDIVSIDGSQVKGGGREAALDSVPPMTPWMTPRVNPTPYPAPPGL
jgi:hypothetical protein